jgi:hypothetical protein
VSRIARVVCRDPVSWSRCNVGKLTPVQSTTSSLSKLGCGVAQSVARRLAEWQAEFESRLGIPQAALFLAEAMRRSRVTLDEYYIQNIVCMLVNVKRKKKSGSMPSNLI